jgi:NADPH:quinone reductase
MQAIVFNQAGEPGDVLRVADVASPRIGGGDVLVRVTARPIHPADLAFIRGQYRIRPDFPQVAGLEGAGVVVEGNGRAGFTQGTRVAFRSPGSWAELAVVPQERLIAVPADVVDENAAQISLNPITAWALLDEAKAGAGDWILVTAATSTVSNLISAIARRRGIPVLGLVRGDAAQAAARSGATQLLSVEERELEARIMAICGERRIAAVLDSVGGPTIPRLFTTLRPGARVVAYGVQDREPAIVTNAMLIYANLTWKGFGIDRWLSELASDARLRMMDELWSMIRSGALALPVDSTHRLADFPAALAADARPQRNGKVLLV